MTLRIGTLLLPLESWPDAASSWRDVEQAGIDIGYTADHITHAAFAGAWLGEAWTTVAAAAAVTDRLEVGTLVASAGIRNPVALARAAATVQDISGGRFVLGIGAGTPADVAADRGVTVTAADLAARYAEVVDGVRAAWAGAQTISGEHVPADTMLLAPTPPGSTPPPLLLAAHGPRGMDLVARSGDGWSTYGGPKAAVLAGEELWAVLRRQAETLDAACERAGRDPALVRRSLLLGYGPDNPMVSVGAFLDAAERSVAAGFDELVVYWPVGPPGSRFAGDPEVVAMAIAQLRSE